MTATRSKAADHFIQAMRRRGRQHAWRVESAPERLRDSGMIARREATRATARAFPRRDPK